MANDSSLGGLAPRVGNDCGLYVNLSGTYAEPSWLEAVETSNVSLSTFEVSQAEVVTRNSDWAVNLSAKFRAELEFQYLWGADTVLLALLVDAFNDRQVFEAWASDGDIVTEPAEGLRFPCNMAAMPRTEGNEDAVMLDTVRLVPALKFTDDVTRALRQDPEWEVNVVPPAAALAQTFESKLNPLQMHKLKKRGRIKVRAHRGTTVQEAWKEGKIDKTNLINQFLMDVAPTRKLILQDPDYQPNVEVVPKGKS